VLLTTTLCNTLSDIGTAEAQSEVTNLLGTLQSLFGSENEEESGAKLEKFLAAFARARSLRPGAEASNYLDKRAPRWQEHKDYVLKVLL
jgi:hypothetical protein